MVADFRNQIPNKLIRRCSNTKYQINKSKSKLEVPKSRSKIEIPNFLLVHTKILVKISRLRRKVVVYEKIPAFPNTKYQINESGWQMLAGFVFSVLLNGLLWIWIERKRTTKEILILFRSR